MGRFLNIQIDRATNLNDWFNRQISMESAALKGANLEGKLYFKGKYWQAGEKHCAGYNIISINFDIKTPPQLTNEDEWYSHMVTNARKLFDFGHANQILLKSELYSTICHFEEPSENELYALTSNKIDLFQKRFSTIDQYVSWYKKEVERYSAKN